ncbi:MAG: hypothetical protein EAZ45_09185 [Oscillatoriales cyanobacterium]|nr:MAG: hypothetical protein EAZ45_09185 [Oscillatoriales cyanobacterium]
MEYLIAAIVLGMLIWAGIEIVQTVRKAEMGQYEANGFVADGAIDSGAKTVGHALHASHCAAEAAGCEATPSAIAHAAESLSHLLHH